MNTVARLASSLLLLTAASGIAVAQNVDRVSAAGSILVAATASKASFGVTARNTTNPTGHLTYVDHATAKAVVQSTSITSYTIVNATTRTITGTCGINGVSGFTFTCTVVDNGEPGTSDTFAIALSSGYTASGTLVGGNVQIHAPGGGGPPPATQLVITSVVPSGIAPLRSFDVTVELRTSTGAVATQANDAVTLALDALPDLLWHASGNTTRVTELVEVTTAATVVGTLPSSNPGEIFGASWSESFGTLVITDIDSAIGLANPTTGDEVRFRNAATLLADLRTFVVDSSGVGHAGEPFSNDRHTIDLVSGNSTIVGDWTFNPAGFTPAGVQGFAQHPTNGTIFGIVRTTAIPTVRQLVTVDLTAGTFANVGSLGDRFSCLAFNPVGVLYGVTGDGAAAPETLFTVDTATGTTTQIAPLGNGGDGEVIALVPRRLGGTTTVNAVAGVATFNDVWFQQIGSNCTLEATTSTLTSAPSTAVQVTGAVAPGASVQFDAATSTVAENVGGGVALVTISLSAPVDYALPVMCTVDNTSTATIGGAAPDAILRGAYQLWFAPGETTKTLTIPIVDDATVETDETVILSIRSAVLATSIGPNATHTLTITSNE